MKTQEQPMRNHEDWLVEIRRILIEIDPVCSLIVVGSIGRGVVRADSDIDMHMVTWRVSDVPAQLPWAVRHTHFDVGAARLDTWALPDERIRKLDLCLHTPPLFQQRVLGDPVCNWGGRRILYDPSGIGAWDLLCSEAFRQANPAIDAELTKWHVVYAAWKANGCTPEWTLCGIEELYARLRQSMVPVACQPFAQHVLEREATG